MRLNGKDKDTIWQCFVQLCACRVWKLCRMSPLKRKVMLGKREWQLKWLCYSILEANYSPRDEQSNRRGFASFGHGNYLPIDWSAGSSCRWWQHTCFSWQIAHIITASSLCCE
jgi:hypothetical protein